MMPLAVHLFGTPQVLYDQTPVEIRIKKALALLAYLVTTAKAQDREKLATLLWPESNVNVARTSLRQALYALKQTPVASILQTSRTTLTLSTDFESDVTRFNELMAHKDYTNTHLPLAAIARLQAAQALYKGDFLDGFHIPGSIEWEDWQMFRRIEYQHQIVNTLAALTQHYIRHQLTESGLKMVQSWLDLDPYNEEAHHLAMHLYVLDGQTERAVEQYHLLTRMLERDQQRSPDETTRQTYEQIRQGAYRSAQPITPPTFYKSVRSLLPKPPVADLPDTEHAMTLYAALYDSQSPPALIVIFNEHNAPHVSNLIAHIAYEEESKRTFPDGILWAALKADDDFDAILQLWMDAMRVSVLKSTSKLEHLAWQFHNGQHDKRILFLLEEATDARHVKLIAPAHDGCTLVVTTSQPDVAEALAEQSDLLIGLPTT